jgi:biopolymer transport protein ExbB/TolQ
MAWWAWLIIWTVLVLGFLGMLAGLGYRLYKKARAALRELDTLTRRVSALAENTETLSSERTARTERAIELGYPEVARRHDEHLTRRAESKQARREARLARGKLLLNPPTIPTLPALSTVPTPRKQNSHAR